MLHKTCPVRVKAAGPDDGLEDGQFEAIVSVFGNRDAYGDVVMPGAFTDTLAEWAAKGDPIPVYWSHRMDDPDYNIGQVLDAKEIDEGLYVKALLDLDEEARKSRQVYRLLKGRRVTQFSFAYDIVEGGWAERKRPGAASDDDTEEVYELRKLLVHEVGPTPIGANRETELLAVKAAAEHAHAFANAVKAGRVLSAKNETTLRAALDDLESSAGQIKNVLAALDDGGEGNDEKAKLAAAAKDEEPDGAKSEEPTRPGPAEASELLSIQLASVS